ncbi:MAG: translocation/assembly module TamB domain-containing protein [Gammaproteobacteria bacterium]
MRFLLKHLVLILLFSLFGLSYFILNTEQGLQTTVHTLIKWVPGKLEIKSANGKLIGNFSLKNISYQNTDQQIEIHSLDIDWNPLGLFRDKILIEKLTLDKAKIKLTKTRDESSESPTWLRFFIVKQFIVKQLSIQYADMQLDFAGTLDNNWQAQWQVNIPHLNLFSPDYAGTVTSSGTISGPFATPQISAQLKAKNLVFINKKIQSLEGKLNFNLRPNTNSMLSLTAHELNFNNHVLHNTAINMEGNVLRKNQALIANLKLNIANDYKMNAVISLPKFTRISDLEQPLSGHAQLHFTNLNFIANVIPDISKPKGNVFGRFIFKGKLGQPELAGEMTLKQGNVAIPKLGIKLNNINLHALSDDLQKITYQGSFQSGKGTAKLQGEFDVSDDSPLSIQLKGDDLEIVKLREYNITASPDLTLNFIKQNLEIKGTVIIPYADISPDNFDSTLTLPNEVVFVDQEIKSIESPFDITMKINLQLGDKIHIAYKNLQTNLSGKLKITQSPAEATTAIGELYATKGTYHTYGQALKIQEGRLIYTGGPLFNPGLNIRAIKQIKTVSVGGESHFDKISNQPFRPVYTGTEIITLGVQIEGTLDRHEISLFSVPSGLSQKEILSYLTLGHSISQATDQQHSALLNAASAINLGGKSKFGDITEKLQNKLGLTELDFTSTEVFDPVSGKVSSTTAFVVGKELTPNLSAHYSKGLFDPIQTLNLRYQLSKRFAIQSETSTIGNGADLLYSIERD